MTVGSKLKQTLAVLKGSEATLRLYSLQERDKKARSIYTATKKTFSLETEDQGAKSDFTKIAEQLDCAMDILKGRQKYIQKQEPQYK